MNEIVIAAAIGSLLGIGGTWVFLWYEERKTEVERE